MSSNALMLIGSTLEALPGGLIDRILSYWPQRERPPIERATFAQASSDKAVLKSSRMVWIFAGGDSRELRELLYQIEEHRLSAVLTMLGDVRPLGASDGPGIAAAPPHAPPIATCAMLRALWGQSEVIRSLMTEMDLLHVSHGGLATQFDKLDEELRLAAQLQREFLPSQLPTAHGVDFRVFFRPASYVSGDIYDVIRLDDHHVGFFIADAVGHGVPAALMTVYIKRSFRTGKRSDDQNREALIIPPAEALAHLNRDMIRQQSGQVRFATACYGVLDCRSRMLTFSRAGHPYPLILRADGTTEWLEPEGGLLGVFPDETFETANVQMNVGDRLLLYSDGFEFAFPDARHKPGHRRRLANSSYTDVFRDLANGSLDVAFNRLVKRIDEQTGSLNQVDDLTALLIGVGERPCEVEEELAATAHTI